MTHIRTLPTHICTLSFCKLLLEVNGDTISIQFMNLPGQLPLKDLLPLLTSNDAVDLVHFVFHRDRLGADFAPLFFEWKDAIQLRREYEKTGQNTRLHKRLLQHLYIVSLRYMKILGSHCKTTDYELIIFFELLETAILSL